MTTPYFNLGIICLKQQNKGAAFRAFQQAKILYRRDQSSQINITFETSFNALINRLMQMKLEQEDFPVLMSPSSQSLSDTVNQLSAKLLLMEQKIEQHDRRLDEQSARIQQIEKLVEETILAEITNLTSAIQSIEATRTFLIDSKSKTYKTTLQTALTATYNKSTTHGRTVGHGASIMNWGVGALSAMTDMVSPLAKIIFSLPITPIIGLYDKYHQRMNDITQRLLLSIAEKITLKRQRLIMASADCELLAQQDANSIMKLFYLEKFEKSDELEAACNNIVSKVVGIEIAPSPSLTGEGQRQDTLSLSLVPSPSNTQPITEPVRYGMATELAPFALTRQQLNKKRSREDTEDESEEHEQTSKDRPIFGSFTQAHISSKSTELPSRHLTQLQRRRGSHQSCATIYEGLQQPQSFVDLVEAGRSTANNMDIVKS